MKPTTLLHKQLCILLAISFLALHSKSQKQLTSFTIGFPVLSLSNGSGVILGASGEWIYNHKFGLGIGASWKIADAYNLPKDYVSGLNIFGSGNLNEMGIFHIRGIYTARLKENGKSRINLQAGPSLIIGDVSEFTPNKNHELFSSNYKVEKKTKGTIGASLSAGFDFPFNRWLGMGVNANGNINSINSFIGGGISIFYGLTDINIPKRKKNRK